MAWLFPPPPGCGPGAPEPLSEEAPVALNMAGVALLHFDVDGLSSREEFVVLRGAGHGDLVLPFA